MKEKCFFSLLLNIILTSIIRPTTEKEIENQKELEKNGEKLLLFNQYITVHEISKQPIESCVLVLHRNLCETHLYNLFYRNIYSKLTTVPTIEYRFSHSYKFFYLVYNGLSLPLRCCEL